jgi:hypothetical protein
MSVVTLIMAGSNPSIPSPLQGELLLMVLCEKH